VRVLLALDREAAGRFPVAASQLRVADLARAGWALVPASAAADGSTTFGIAHRFHSPAEANALLAALSGRDGPVRLQVGQDRSIARTTTRLTGEVDLRRGPDAFADPRLAAALGAPSLTSALINLQQAGGAAPSFSVQVAAYLPGRASPRTFSVPLGNDQDVSATSRAFNLENLAFAAVAVSALAGLGVMAFFALFGRGRDPWTGRRRRRRDTWRLADRRGRL